MIAFINPERLVTETAPRSDISGAALIEDDGSEVAVFNAHGMSAVVLTFCCRHHDLRVARMSIRLHDGCC
ncbi:MAG: hypothetical protein P1V21_12625 [Rhizobiaceae bacterium]|nr:hypothetical protein [Rhizobiaceae bacterium]